MLTVIVDYPTYRDLDLGLRNLSAEILTDILLSILNLVAGYSSVPHTLHRLQKRGTRAENRRMRWMIIFPNG